ALRTRLWVTGRKQGFPRPSALSEPRARHLASGAGRHSKNGRVCWSARRTSWNAGATNYPRSKSSRSANRGMKPMETFARPSIFAGSMRSRCDVSDVRGSHNVFPERIAIITIGRAASHLSLHHGIFRSRFFAEWHLPEL